LALGLASVERPNDSEIGNGHGHLEVDGDQNQSGGHLRSSIHCAASGSESGLEIEHEVVTMLVISRQVEKWKKHGKMTQYLTVSDMTGVGRVVSIVSSIFLPLLELLFYPAELEDRPSSGVLLPPLTSVLGIVYTADLHESIDYSYC
jgi:hypothetical protein